MYSIETERERKKKEGQRENEIVCAWALLKKGTTIANEYQIYFCYNWLINFMILLHLIINRRNFSFNDYKVDLLVDDIYFWQMMYKLMKTLFYLLENGKLSKMRKYF